MAILFFAILLWQDSRIITSCVFQKGSYRSIAAVSDPKVQGRGYLGVSLYLCGCVDVHRSDVTITITSIQWLLFGVDIVITLVAW